MSNVSFNAEMLAPCSTLSRTLRAGFAGAAQRCQGLALSGILDNVCARRSADRQVGTKGWRLRSNKGMGRKQDIFVHFYA
jgi:hypothetical protein